MQPKELQAERIKAFNDIYTGVIPTRIPIQIFLSLEVIAEHYGIDLIAAQWDHSILAEAADKICGEFYSDICPYKGANRSASFYSLLNSQSYVMSSTGFIQHPEVHCMEPEDYDDFIASPFDTIIEKFLPRQYKSIDPSDPFRMAMQIAMAIMAKDDDFKAIGQISSALVEKYGYFKAQPGIDGFCPAPFDFIADELRGFSGITIDLRRNPQKVIEACEAIYPLVIHSATPTVISDYGHVSMMLHMPSFINTKDFEKFYWPTFKNMADEFASMGVHTYAFCEGNWDRYIDHLAELPVNTFLSFEYGDAKMIKEKLGRRHSLMGFYPLSFLRSKSKDECVDEAKRLMDIMMPGGRYIFKYDKGPITDKDMNFENALCVNEYIRDNTSYENPGTYYGEVFNKEDYSAVAHKPFESKYWKTLTDIKNEYAFMNDTAVKRFGKYEDKLSRFYKGLIS